MQTGEEPASRQPTLVESSLRLGRATMWVAVAALVTVGLSVFLITVSLVDVQAGGSDHTARAGYCSVPGNTNVDGSALQPGTYLDLIVGEPTRNGRYSGAVPANFIHGIGLTCSAPPPGYVRRGLATVAQNVRAGIYPYYVPPGS